MVLKLSISPETEARLRRQAEAQGKDVTAYISELIERTAAEAAQTAHANGEELSADEFDRLLAEFFAQNPERLPRLPAHFSRADIYNEHD